MSPGIGAGAIGRMNFRSHPHGETVSSHPELRVQLNAHDPESHPVIREFSVFWGSDQMAIEY